VLNRCDSMGQKTLFEIAVGLLVGLGQEKYDAVFVLGHDQSFRIHNIIYRSYECKGKKGDHKT